MARHRAVLSVDDAIRASSGAELVVYGRQDEPLATSPLELAPTIARRSDW